jgi:hypothetical protein
LALEGRRIHIFWLLLLLVSLNSFREMTPSDILLTSLRTAFLCLLVLLAAAALRRQPRILLRYALQASIPRILRS